jgi:hypothetical protein
MTEVQQVELTIDQEARQLKKLREERDAAKSVFEDTDRAYKVAMDHLYQRMEAGSVDGLKVDGVSFVPSETVYANVQDREAFVSWAKENDEQLIEDKERKALLNAAVRERLDNGETLPDGVGFYVRESISLRSS